MKAFQAIALAGLTAASISAQAGVITFPESISFDINADPGTFSVPFTGDPREGFSNGINVPVVLYTLENDTFYARFDDFGYNDRTIDFGLQILFSAQRPSGAADAKGKEVIIGPLLGQIYTYSVWFNFYDLEPYEGGFASGAYGGTVNESVQVSFFDGSAQVPVGPTAPLLLAGLVGLWLRKRSTK